MNSLDVAVVGNCSFGALIDASGRAVWTCLPRFDGDPVFCSLVNGQDGETAGFFDVELFDSASASQCYLRNTAIVATTLRDKKNAAIEVIDFAPRFKQFGRVYRPTMLVRQIRPLAGRPRIRIRLRPTYGYGLYRPTVTRGSNHIRYVMPDAALRLTTDASVTDIQEEIPFLVEEPVTLILGPDESLPRPIAESAREFLEKTTNYWEEWCRFLALPFEWQEAVIRAAITLKLCSFEESGAIVAAMTTSIPESSNSRRNWDYRLCWLRDSYFVVHALNRLGVTRTMERYLGYITNIVSTAVKQLPPVYSVTRGRPQDEYEVSSLRGYRGMGPVRVGNDAHQQVQNDGYGSVILACAQSFFDKRLANPGTPALFESLEHLGERAVSLWDQPDSGIWELRTREDVHTFSSVMCWAACARLAKIAARLERSQRKKYWSKNADRIRSEILKRAWNPDLNSFVSIFGGNDVDASLLLLWELGFVPANDRRFLGTLDLIEKQLRRGSYMFRYTVPDDFGAPATAFNVCTFWYIDALAAVGRVSEARDLFENMLQSRNPAGLLSEDIDPETTELWGNIPQTYSMVGLINSAMRLSKSWEEALWVGSS